MKKAKALVALSLAAAMALSVIGCGSSSSSNNAAPAADASVAAEEQQQTGTIENQAGQDATGAGEKTTEGIQAGTEFTYWINTDYPVALPWMDNNASQLQIQLYDNLLYRYHGDSADMRCNLAESYTVSDDGTVYVFKIKEGVKFTSGNEVTAEAFVKCWDVAKEYKANYFGVVKSYEATDKYELTITLNNASPTFLYDLPSQHSVGIVDPALLEEYGTEDNRAAVGCGPYYIESYTSGEGYVLKANPDYHNPDRAPSVETCKLEIIPDINTAMVGLMSGQVDCINTSDMEVVETLEASGWDTIAWEARVHPWWFNAREVEVFQDEAVRKGLVKCVDWDAINDLVYNGRFSTLTSYWGTGNGSAPYNEEYRYDPETGVAEIEAAGYKLEDIKFVIECNPDFANQVTAIVAQLNELGFTGVTMETYDMSTCLGMIKGGTYHMTTTHNGYSTENPLQPYSMGLTSSSIQPIIWLEYMNQDAAAAAQEHYDKALASTTFEEFEAETAEITKICQDNYCALGGLQRYGFYAVNPDFAGVYITPVVGYLEFCYLYSTK